MIHRKDFSLKNDNCFSNSVFNPYWLHNYWLQIIVNLGVIFTTFYLLFITKFALRIGDYIGIFIALVILLASIDTAFMGPRAPIIFGFILGIPQYKKAYN